MSVTILTTTIRVSGTLLVQDGIGDRHAPNRPGIFCDDGHGWCAGHYVRKAPDNPPYYVGTAFTPAIHELMSAVSDPCEQLNRITLS